mmetsp:Transcript_7744/g.32034  ORF Transcript_7744/g.32034 Transcript_7744/m.32034 type:complete len:140 (-) Transcript_7744:274-693(-)
MGGSSRRALVLAALAASSAAFSLGPAPRLATVLRVGDIPDSDPAGTFRYDNSDSISPLEKRQAIENTANWCLERCIKLGHCEVFEDLNKMTTAQVQDFCKACILEGENTPDECDISFMFTPDAPWAGKQKPDELAELSK